MMYRINPKMPFSSGQMIFFTIAHAKRYLKEKYPSSHIELWLEKGEGPHTTVVEKWERLAGHKNFRRVI